MQTGNILRQTGIFSTFLRITSCMCLHSVPTYVAYEINPSISLSLSPEDVCMQTKESPHALRVTIIPYGKSQSFCSLISSLERLHSIVFPSIIYDALLVERDPSPWSSDTCSDSMLFRIRPVYVMYFDSSTTMLFLCFTWTSVSVHHLINSRWSMNFKVILVECPGCYVLVVLCKLVT